MIFFFFVVITLWVVWRLYSFVAYRRLNYSGKTILITGATSEVGWRLCFRFYGLNARIIAWDSAKFRLEELQREVVSYYNDLEDNSVAEESASPTSAVTTTATTETSAGKVPPIAGLARAAASACTVSGKNSENFIVQSVDLSARLSLQRLAKELVSGGTVPDVIFHCSHSQPTKSFLERPDDAMEKIVCTNTLAPLWIAKALLPAMLEKRTSCQIVHFVTSAADQCAQPTDAPDYIASQWGAVGAHYALRRWLQAQRHAWTGVGSEGPLAGMRPSGGTAVTTGSRTSASAGRVSDIRVCLVSLRDIQRTSASIFSIPYAAERGLSREEPDHASGATSLGVSSARGSSRGATSSGAAGAGTGSRLSPSQLASREAKRMDAVVDRAIRAIMCGVERYADRSLSNWYPLLEILPVPWYAKLIQWFDV